MIKGETSFTAFSDTDEKSKSRVTMTMTGLAHLQLQEWARTMTSLEIDRPPARS